MINSVAVLGAGVMGAQIAAHFANAGVRSLLLDVTAEAAEQSRICEDYAAPYEEI